MCNYCTKAKRRHARQVNAYGGSRNIRKDIVTILSEPIPVWMGGCISTWDPETKAQVVVQSLHMCGGCRKQEEKVWQFMRCSLCALAYCSIACQKAHWPKHKADCRKWKEELDSFKGCPVCAPRCRQTSFTPCETCGKKAFAAGSSSSIHPCNAMCAGRVVMTPSGTKHLLSNSKTLVMNAFLDFNPDSLLHD